MVSGTFWVFVSGFGLLGHAENLARNQKNEVSFSIHSLPIIADMAKIAKASGNVFQLKQGKATWAAWLHCGMLIEFKNYITFRILGRDEWRVAHLLTQEAGCVLLRRNWEGGGLQSLDYWCRGGGQRNGTYRWQTLLTGGSGERYRRPTVVAFYSSTVKEWPVSSKGALETCQEMRRRCNAEFPLYFWQYRVDWFFSYPLFQSDFALECGLTKNVFASCVLDYCFYVSATPAFQWLQMSKLSMVKTHLTWCS